MSVRDAPVTAPPRNRVLQTVGYQGFRSLDDFVGYLSDAGVTDVLDVRELPLSRRRGFSKTPLSEGLGEAGIAYAHDRRLGNPKSIRTLFWEGEVARGRGLYAEHLRENAFDAVTSLARRLESGPICLLCLEHDRCHCHRDVIADLVADCTSDARVLHL